jgi:hypothetical protein
MGMVDLEFPAIVSLDDLALWRSMRRVLRMAGMCSDRTDWDQGTAAQHEWCNDGSAPQLRPGGCKAGDEDRSDHPEDEKTNEQPGMAHHHGVFGDAYRLAQAGGRKHWPSRHGGNLQVKRIGTADRKAILQYHHTVYEFRVEGEKRGALHPGQVCR